MNGAAACMRRAIELAKTAWGRTAPNPMVGCVLVKNGRIIGEGYHHRAGEFHAEVEALRSCKCDPVGAAAFVTLEPCSSTGHQGPCTEALIAAGISRVTVGSLDPNPAHAGRGLEILRQAGIQVSTGVCREACEELNYPFFKWITRHRPYVVLKMAMTLDGRIATSSGDSKWITGEEARGDVQHLRKLAGAILIGSETARIDRPQLTVRDVPDWPCQPKRFIAGHAELPGFTSIDLADEASWNSFLAELASEECLMLLIEGGGELAGRALQAHVVDEAVFYVAPKLLTGRGSRPVTGGKDPEKLTDALDLDEFRTKYFGGDLRISGYIKGGWADVYRHR